LFKSVKYKGSKYSWSFIDVAHFGMHILDSEKKEFSCDKNYYSGTDDAK